jgi:hypothetical protein
LEINERCVITQSTKNKIPAADNPCAAEDAATAMMESAAKTTQQKRQQASENLDKAGVVVQSLGFSILIIVGSIFALNILLMSDNINQAARVFILFALPAYLVSTLIRYLLTGSRKPFPWQ